jgi:hypothetical protein
MSDPTLYDIARETADPRTLVSAGMQMVAHARSRLRVCGVPETPKARMIVTIVEDWLADPTDAAAAGRAMEHVGCVQEAEDSASTSYCRACAHLARLFSHCITGQGLPLAHGLSDISMCAAGLDNVAINACTCVALIEGLGRLNDPIYIAAWQQEAAWQRGCLESVLGWSKQTLSDTRLRNSLLAG